MKKTLTGVVIAAVVVVVAVLLYNNRGEQTATTPLPSWIESDSLQAIHARLLYDFPKTVDEMRPEIKAHFPELTDADIDKFIELKYIETLEIDGQLRVHRKVLRNLPLLNPQMSGVVGRGNEASPQRIAYVDSALAWSRGQLPTGGAHRITYRFTIEVPFDTALVGQTLRVWMPLPLDSAAVDYQGDVEVLETSQPEYTLSSDAANGRDVHCSIYMEGAAPDQPGDTAIFSYIGRYVAKAKYRSPEYIMEHMQSYDTTSAVYKKYTAFDGPHYVRLDSLAHAIVGEETNPVRQSRLVFDYIQDHYPWAGAREYSTIECIPTYVIEQGHGDCGQVTLLYISLMRTLGVPARWVSGWMLHPGEKNWHDWGATYYEGIGWIPVDVSFGCYCNAVDPEVHYFYNTGIDSWRMCINPGVGLPMAPEKQFVRSETVDFQAGEVECALGNIFYPAWYSTLDVLKTERVENGNR